MLSKLVMKLVHATLAADSPPADGQHHHQGNHHQGQQGNPTREQHPAPIDVDSPDYDGLYYDGLYYDGFFHARIPAIRLVRRARVRSISIAVSGRCCHAAFASNFIGCLDVLECAVRSDPSKVSPQYLLRDGRLTKSRAALRAFHRSLFAPAPHNNILPAHEKAPPL